jgi:hypothetical protein
MISSTLSTACTTTTNTSTTAATPSTTSSTTPPWEVDTYVLQNILSYIGKNQYRYVAAISKTFHVAYEQLFPNHTKQTYYNASTIERARLCFECPILRHSDSVTLCNSAVRYGSLVTLQYLRSIHFQWDSTTFDTAAQYGHVHILEYLRTHGCPHSELVCHAAAKGGQLTALQWAHAHDFPWDAFVCA